MKEKKIEILKVASTYGTKWSQLSLGYKILIIILIIFLSACVPVNDRYKRHKDKYYKSLTLPSKPSLLRVLLVDVHHQ